MSGSVVVVVGAVLLAFVGGLGVGVMIASQVSFNDSFREMQRRWSEPTWRVTERRSDDPPAREG